MKTAPGSLTVLAALIAAVSSLPAVAAAPAPAPAVTAHVVAMLKSGVQAGPAPASKAKAAFALPDGEGKEPAERVCSACHSPSVFTKQRHDQAGWSTIVNQMIAKGADGSDDDFAKILSYLTTNFGPDSAAPAAAPATPPASH
jgi:cytochrome c5